MGFDWGTVFVCLFGCLWLGGSPRCAGRPTSDSPVIHPSRDSPNPVDILYKVRFEVLLPSLHSEQCTIRGSDLAKFRTMCALMHWRDYIFGQNMPRSIYLAMSWTMYL